MNSESENKRVALVIEDNEELAFLFSESLQRAGFQTEIVTSGDLAMGRLRDLRPEIVVLDLSLPNLSGQEILHQIRNDENLTDIRVIVASANHRMAEQLRGKADLVLIKPVGFKQLRDLAVRLTEHLTSQ